MKIVCTEKVRFDSKVAMNVNSVAEIMKKNELRSFQSDYPNILQLTSEGSQRVKMDLNKRLLPEQKTIKTLKYNPQGFKITIN